MMEAVHTSETSVNFNLTIQRYIPEDSELHTRRRENLKSYSNPITDRNEESLCNIYRGPECIRANRDRSHADADITLSTSDCFMFFLTETQTKLK
jgi:hypothetical protein